MVTSEIVKTCTKDGKEWSPTLLEKYDAFMFDCDGVLWRGADPIPGAKETLEMLMSAGKKVFFVTNNSTKSREQYTGKFKETLGVQVPKESIFGSAFAASTKVASLPNFNKETQKVFIVGDDGIAIEMEEQGIKYIHSKTAIGQKHMTGKEIAAYKLDPTVGAVVVGMDFEFTYTKCAIALRYLRENPDILFVSTNQDVTFPFSKECLLPGSGCVVNMIASGSGRTPINCGKPETWLFDIAVQQFGLDKSRIMFVGDRIDTDIVFGNTGGVSTFLVLSGITTTEFLTTTPPTGVCQPDYIVESVADLGQQ
eukprot:GFYU01002498.1.p1 GENE.GFYU01002498.1~~GFYU01002498.1.p1  ORF type:complete len:310 (+),score=66.08 GFYU01002498.1:96-1025(+)